MLTYTRRVLHELVKINGRDAEQVRFIRNR